MDRPVTSLDRLKRPSCGPSLALLAWDWLECNFLDSSFRISGLKLPFGRTRRWRFLKKQCERCSSWPKNYFQLFLQNLKKLELKSLLLLSVCFVASCNWRSWSMVRMMNVGQKLGWWRISFKRFVTAIFGSTSILCILMLPGCSTSNQNPPVALWSSFTITKVAI